MDKRHDKEIYAHTLWSEPPDRWELLSTHAAAVATLAGQFAQAFDAECWGNLLGHWHDLGKASAAFQARLYQSNGIDAGEEGDLSGRVVDHSTFGARHAAGAVPNLAGQLLAFCIAGHHAGLADAVAADDTAARSTLAYRLNPDNYPIEPIPVLNTVSAPPLRFPLAMPTADERGFAFAFFTRMLFSVLIDADRTATEAFCNPIQAAQRRGDKPTLAQMQRALDAFLAQKQRDAPATHVNRVRARVLAQCLAAANSPAGFFSLNVPTGGGKTLASLAFALHHARALPKLRRVIVAIPFTSIIEQTADQYRHALGTLAEAGLVEHQSNLNPKHDTLQNKLAVENWDAPLIVTTNVQLYESLFAAATTPARKLHRLAHSVIILDEAQSMPIDLLKPTLAALRELVNRYGCTVVLCTATQPALEHRAQDFEIGLRNVRPMIENAASLYRELKRVEIVRLGNVRDEELVQRLVSEPQVLCVVNTKAHAAKVYDGLVQHLGHTAGCYHLSTFMCAQHRRDVLRRIRRTLHRNRLALRKGLAPRPCRIISTQLIEAGVDIDLPVVYRAPAGFDSIAQAAGRCNREGKLVDQHGNPVLGRVYVFETHQPPPPGLLRDAAQAGAELAHIYPDPLAPAAVEAYFKLLYWTRSHEWDKHGVMDCFYYDRDHIAEHRTLAPFKFRTAAAAYQLIREQTTPILVPYSPDGKRMVEHIAAGLPIDNAFWRRAQKYIVSVRDDFLQRLHDNAVLVPHEAGLWALVNETAYSPEKGMLPNVAGIGVEILTV